MAIVGYVAVGLVGVGILVGLGLVAASLPDIGRYLRMRRM